MGHGRLDGIGVRDDDDGGAAVTLADALQCVHHPALHLGERLAFRFPNGESFTEMQGRIVDTLDRIRQRHLGATVVVVSHADPIKAAVAYSLGTPLDLFQRIFIAPCSVSAVVYGEGGPAVLTVNAVGSLAELRAS